MTNIISLDSIREDVERKFKPVVIDLGGTEVTLRNLLRLDATKRREVTALLKSVQRDGDESVDADEVLASMHKVLEIVADDVKSGKALTKALAGDLTVTMEVIHLWTEATQPGEAENSDG